ncbi:MAG: hypothetical protein ACJAYR_002127 [Sneathiella sp.]|jgi:hypothetical protein
MNKGVDILIGSDFSPKDQHLFTVQGTNILGNSSSHAPVHVPKPLKISAVVGLFSKTSLFLTMLPPIIMMDNRCATEPGSVVFAFMFL